MTKICSTCKFPKDLNDFPREPRNADGRNCECKECKHKKNMKKYYEKKKEREMFY